MDAEHKQQLLATQKGKAGKGKMMDEWVNGHPVVFVYVCQSSLCLSIIEGDFYEELQDFSANSSILFTRICNDDDNTIISCCPV